MMMMANLIMRIADHDDDSLYGTFVRLVLLLWSFVFWDLSTQALAHGGSSGFNPLAPRLKLLERQFGRSRPNDEGTNSIVDKLKLKLTLFWFRCDDAAIKNLPYAGMISAFLGALGIIGTTASFAINLCVYHSMDGVFEGGLRYPWEKLLFEIGAISLFGPSLSPVWRGLGASCSPSPLLLFAYRFLFVRLMLGFGKTKFIDNEETTDNAFYIRNFLYAQPMPSKLALAIVRFAPPWRWLWNAKVWFMWAVEIPIPFLAMTPLRWVAAASTIALQIGIFAGGCFGFFNVLTMILSLSLMIDASEDASYSVLECCLFTIHSFIGFVCLVSLNSGTTFMWSHFPKVIWDVRNAPGPWLGRIVALVRFANETRIVHGYGVFPRNKLAMVRQTPYIEGTWDGGKTWQRYEYRFLGLTECKFIVAPRHPKMDFTLWYHGNGMNLEGFPCSLASSSPYAFSGLGMLDRIALRLLENARAVKDQFRSIPNESAPNAVRINIMDENGVSLMKWRPSEWKDWLPDVGEFHWDAMLWREKSAHFLRNVEALKSWIVSPKKDSSRDSLSCAHVLDVKLHSYVGQGDIRERTVAVTGADIFDVFDSDFAPTKLNRVIVTYLTHILAHEMMPWPKETSWFSVSLAAHSALLRGFKVVAEMLRTGARFESFAPQNAFAVYRSLYPLQWAQTERTITKLTRFDVNNTGQKIPIKGASILEYTDIFLGKEKDM